MELKKKKNRYFCKHFFSRKNVIHKISCNCNDGVTVTRNYTHLSCYVRSFFFLSFELATQNSQSEINSNLYGRVSTSVFFCAVARANFRIFLRNIDARRRRIFFSSFFLEENIVYKIERTSSISEFIDLEFYVIFFQLFFFFFFIFSAEIRIIDREKFWLSDNVLAA